MHFGAIRNEFEIWPDRTKDWGGSCPERLRKSPCTHNRKNVVTTLAPSRK